MSEHRHPRRFKRPLFRYRFLFPGTLLLYIAVGCLLGTTGCAAGPFANGFGARLGTTLDNDAEKAIVLSNFDVGTLAVLSEGTRAGETVLTVHGINAGPDAVAPIHERAIRRGARLLTFVYDDRKRRLVNSSDELARALDAEIGGHAPDRLLVAGHSMGGRIAVAALAQLAREKRLRTRAIELRLLAPALGGFEAANAAVLAPKVFQRIIGGVAPGVDMGSRSPFQAMLERVELPPNVTTRIFVGAEDEVIDAKAPRFLGVARRLHADVVVVPGADHDSIVGRVASM